MADNPNMDAALPQIEFDSAPFWDAVRERAEFTIVKCSACGAYHHYPRPFCPSCWSDDVELIAASGKATLYTYSIVHYNDLPPFADKVPYVAAIVELAEGPRIMTQIVDCEFDALKIGQPLTLVTTRVSDDITLPLFTPAS